MQDVSDFWQTGVPASGLPVNVVKPWHFMASAGLDRLTMTPLKLLETGAYYQNQKGGIDRN